MATKHVITDLNFDIDGTGNSAAASALRNFLADPRTADPVAPVAGQMWFNTTDGRYRGFDGTDVCDFACLSDLEIFGAFQGPFSATPGAIPANLVDGSGPGGAIRAGDKWVIAGDGTIVGIQGSDVLTSGDFILALTDGAATAADFAGIEQNQDLSGLSRSEDVVIGAVAANTALPVVTTIPFANVQSVQWFDAAGNEYIGCVNKGLPVTVEANVAIPAGSIVSVVGMT